MKFILDITPSDAGRMSRLAVADATMDYLTRCEEDLFGVVSFDGVEPQLYDG